MTSPSSVSGAFSMADQHWFAAASGDWNPLHVDADYARRLLFGEPVVHGVHLVLWALDRHFHSGGACPAALQATFKRPARLGETLALSSEAGADGQIELSVTGDRQAAVSIRLKGRGVTGATAASAPVLPRAWPVERDFPSLKGLSGNIVAALPDDVARRYPHAAKILGGQGVAGLLGLTRIVGMDCPGLHSLFSTIDITFDGHGTERLDYAVTQHHSPQAPLTLAVSGAGLQGKVTAFFRPVPVEQPDMTYLSTVIAAGSCAGQTALVVGGSRGLGEVTAKLVACGGGEVIVTYYRGQADAQRVVDEIVTWGGQARAVQLDVTRPDCLAGLDLRPTHLYYYATPYIGAPRQGVFDTRLSENFHRTYVSAFAELVLSLLASAASGLSVFYPSTVWVDEMPRDFPEYVTAKAAGEALCTYLGRHCPGLTILATRLPRVATDQTVGLIRRAVADPVPLIADIVQAMHQRGEKTS